MHCRRIDLIAYSIVNKPFCTSVSIVLIVLALLLGPAEKGAAAAPDLTSTNLASIDTTLTYNLGPTGMRGWIYNHSSGYTNGTQGTTTSFQPWQILVTTVGSNTPAFGILASNDVILGVSTGAGNLPVPLFTNDARKSFGWAIGAAEAGDGKMNFKRWRAGVTNDVTIQLQLTNLAYSATAPYNCPKSAAILSNACNVIASQSFPGVPGGPVLGLALLACGNTNFLPKVRTYAYSIAPVNLSLRFSPGEQTHSADAWGWGYKGVFLAEYYLLTGDTNVLHGINEYTVALAQAQSRYGTMSHGGALLNADGSFHGTMGPYGPVNQGGLVANLAIVMGKKCLVASGMPVDPEINPAIDRAAKFFSFYVQKGNIPYGEHEPWPYHAGNGKESLAAVLFAMMGDKPAETEYWTRLVLAGFNGREYGHTGQGFSYLWGGMAANVGGTNAMAAYLAQIRWHLDLERRADGSFTYDGNEQFGGSALNDYWGAASYYSIDPTATYILTYGVAQQQLLITGKSANPTNWLDTAKISNAIWAGTFDQVVTSLDTNQLMSALGEFDPLVRSWAANELGVRSNVSYAALTNLASSTNPWLRQSACEALGAIKNTNALDLLGRELTDTDIWARAKAASAIRNFMPTAFSAQMTNLLMAFTNNATDPNVIVWSDPIQIANGLVGFALFGDAVYGGNNIATNVTNASKSLYYSALQVGLKQPDSKARLGPANFALNNLTLADVKALLPDLIEVAVSESQADTMWSMNPRARGISTLSKYKVAEAIPIALSMLVTPTGFDWNSDGFKVPALNALAAYGDLARWTLPTLNNYLVTWNPTSTEFPTLVSTIASITSAIGPPAGLTNLFPVANSQVIATTNATAITLTGFSWRTNLVSFTNVSAPVHGTLTGTAPNLTYTPANNYVGPDSFRFQVADGFTNSPMATVSIIVGSSAGKGLKGEYFDNSDFTNLKFTRTDPQINFDWGTGSPSNSIGADTFSVRWSGLLLAPETGNYTFSTLNSDGVRLYVNGVLVIDDFTDQTTGWTDGTPIALTAGQMYDVQMDFYENTGSAVAKLKWTGPSFAGSNGVLIGTEWLFDGAGVTNRPAFAFPQNVTMIQNTNLAITLEGSGGSNLTYSILTPPGNGSLSGTPPNVIYTPASNYNGMDSFTFFVNNGVSNSAPAAVSVAVWAGTPVAFTWKSALPGAWSTSTNWTNSAGTAAAPNAAGQPFYTLNFNKAGTYTVTNDLSDGFALNQLNVTGAVTFAGANSLTFAGNGPILPQINQKSASAVTFDHPLNLAATTTLGGSGSGTVTIPNVISGSGALIKNTPGVLNVNYGTNTYSGGTIINAGTVAFPAYSVSTTALLGTGPVTVGAPATLALNRSYLSNSITFQGGTVTAGNSFVSTLAGPVALQGVTTFDISGNLTIAGDVSGPGGLVKSGGASVPLRGTNTYTGPTTVSEGTLQFKTSLYGNDTSKWTPANVTVSSDATLTLNVGGAGEFTPAQAATLLSNLSVSVNHNGFQAGSFFGLDTANATGPVNFSGVIADSTGTGGGAVGFKKSSAGTLQLSGANTYSGKTYIYANGPLSVSSLNYVASGSLSPNTSSSLGHPITVVNGTIDLGINNNNGGANLTYTGTGETTDRVINLAAQGNNVHTLDHSGTGLLKFTAPFTINAATGQGLTLQGSTAGIGEIVAPLPLVSGTLTKSGTGTWILDGANTYTNVTTINGGALVLSNANALPGGTSTTGGISDLTFNGGVVGLGSGDFTRNLAAVGTGAAANFSGNGGWAAYGADRVVNLGGASTQVIWTNVGSGFNGKTLLFSATSATHTVVFQNPVDLGPAARTIQVAKGAAKVDARMSGAISGSAGGNLTKTGLGTLEFSGANTYPGTTAVSAGALLVNGSLGTNAVTVNSGATLGGTGTIGGNVTLSSGASAQFTTAGTLAIAGKLVLNSNVVHLALSNNVPVGTYTLATYNPTGSTGKLNSTPVVDAGSFATNVALSVTNSGGNVLLTVAPVTVPPTPSMAGGTILVTNGATSFTFLTTTGFKYRWNYKNAMTDSNWSPLLYPPNFPAPNGWSAVSTGAPMNIIDTNAVGLPRRFYQIETTTP